VSAYPLSFGERRSSLLDPPLASFSESFPFFQSVFASFPSPIPVIFHSSRVTFCTVGLFSVWVARLFHPSLFGVIVFCFDLSWRFAANFPYYYESAPLLLPLISSTSGMLFLFWSLLPRYFARWLSIAVTGAVLTLRRTHRPILLHSPTRFQYRRHSPLSPLSERRLLFFDCRLGAEIFSSPDTVFLLPMEFIRFAIFV